MGSPSFCAGIWGSEPRHGQAEQSESGGACSHTPVHFCIQKNEASVRAESGLGMRGPLGSSQRAGLGQGEGHASTWLRFVTRDEEGISTEVGVCVSLCLSLILVPIHLTELGPFIPSKGTVTTSACFTPVTSAPRDRLCLLGCHGAESGTLSSRPQTHRRPWRGHWDLGSPHPGHTQSQQGPACTIWPSGRHPSAGSGDESRAPGLIPISAAPGGRV